MDILAPFRFQFYTSMSLADAWQKLTSVTHQSQLSLFSKVEVLDDDPGYDGIYIGELTPHHFKLMRNTGSWFTEGPPFVVRGHVEQHLNGSTLKAMVRPTFFASIIYALFWIWFLGFTARQIFEAKEFSIFGFAVFGGAVLLNTIIWLRAVRRHKRMLSEILDGKELPTPAS